MAGGKVIGPPGLIHVGTITKPQGIRGEVRIHSLSGQPENFRDYPEIVLIAEKDRPRNYKVTSFRSQGNVAVVALAGVADRNGAEALVGCQVWVAEEALAPLAADEFYWHEVMGAEVKDLEGNFLGNLTSLLTAGGTELMVVQQDGEEMLIPSGPEFVVEIGRAGIIVDLPPGFHEINRAQ
jgi:16S rRNA processing protein RimM